MGWIDGWVWLLDEWMDGIGECMDVWLAGWIGWEDRWMDG